MTFTLPTLPASLLPLLAWGGGALLVLLYLRKGLTPAKVLGIFETDGVLSARQMLAWVVALYGMAMRAAYYTDALGKVVPRLDNDGLQACFECSFILFGIGGLVKAAEKVKGPTTVNAKRIEGDVTAQNLNLNTNASSAPAE